MHFSLSPERATVEQVWREAYYREQLEWIKEEPLTVTPPAQSSLSEEDKAKVAAAIGAPPAAGVLAAIDHIAADTGAGVDDLVTLLTGPECRPVFDAFHLVGHDFEAIIRSWHNTKPETAAHEQPDTAGAPGAGAGAEAGGPAPEPAPEETADEQQWQG